MITFQPVSARVTFTRRPFLRPLRLSSVTITEITEARAEVTVEDAQGQRATGAGAIYLSDLWAWPDATRTAEERDAAMRAFVERQAAALSAIVGEDKPHVLEAGLRLHRAALDAPDSPLPPLARLVSASPLDAALHDVVGQLADVSAFALYDEDAPVPSADDYFGGSGGTIRAVRQLLQNPPDTELDAILVVGKGDELSSLDEWIGHDGRGYRAFKLKIGGIDPNEDAQRTSDVYRYALSRGVAAPRLTVDANCASPDAATVAAFLDALASLDSDAYAALEALEQPTGRDIHTHAFDWHRVAARRPVLLDEGLTDWPDLFAADAQGWNGLAVKTCRGHSFSIATAAWMHQQGGKLTVMDLTNPGIAAIQSALVAAHLPGVTAIEMNAAQYTPAANADWLPRLTPLLAPTNGTHQIPTPLPKGLGSRL